MKLNFIGFLRPVPAKYIEGRKTDSHSSSPPEQNDQTR